jgi:hypothetical protein
VNDRKDVSRIYDALGRVLESAIRHQETADTSVAQLNLAAKKMGNVADELKGQLSREISTALQDASCQAAELLTKKFRDADQYANAAAARYQRSVRGAVWKIVLGAAVAGSAAMGTGAYMVMRSVPSYEEIQTMRAEAAMLKKNVATLEEQGGRARISRCANGTKKGRLCIQIDETAVLYKDGYRVIAGY